MQNDRLLKYLKRRTRKGITQAEALTNLGIMRLSERIRELEERGIEIRRMREINKNRDGNYSYPMRYFFIKEGV